ncbi:retrovirus-related pol polyprotein from transposon TNT 1-94 [Tanacetum coccineum]
MCDNDIQTDQNAKDERAALANLIANVTLDTEENKKILKQLKNANASLTQELKECKSNLEESNTTRDSCLIALQSKQTELEMYKTLIDRTIDYDKLERKLNETLGLLARKEIDIKEGLKLKAYEISVVKEKHNENQSIQTIHMLASNGSTFNGRPTFANPMYLKIAQSEKPCLYEIAYDTYDLANRFVPDREKTLTLEKDSLYRIDTKTTQTKAPQLSQTSRNTDPRLSTSTGVIYRTNVSRPQLRSTQMKDKIVQLILFIVDSGCTKHMTSNLKLLCNFVEKYLGTIHFSNDQFALILSYKDLVQGNITINRVYYVEGLNHNLFSGNGLLIGNRGSDLYTTSLQETTSSTLICFMAKSSPTQAWLWHRRLSHLNFDYINLLSKKDIMIGLPKLKYIKDQLCSSCKVSKAKRSSFKTKAVPSSKGRLNLLHIDLCGPIWVEIINRKKYILVIVDDYSRYTWTLFLRSKDETPEVLKYFLKMIQRNLQA